MKSFNHSFAEPLTQNDTYKIHGYNMALRGLLMQLQEMTQFKPEKRMIDAVVLLDMITATQEELAPLLASYGKSLELPKINSHE